MKVFLILLSLVLFFASSNLWAQEDVKPTFQEQANAVLNEGKKFFSESKERRQQTSYVVMFNYSLIDLIVPGKMGLTLAMNSGAGMTQDFEYLSGKIVVPSVVADIGKFEDTRVSYIRRFYSERDTFNWFWGVSYFQTQIKLGDALLNRLTDGSYPSVGMMDMQSLGLNVGLGNRWVFGKNITLGVDWLAWSQPLFSLKRSTPYLDYVSDEQDKEDVENAVNLAMYLPRWTVLKIQFGMSF